MATLRARGVAAGSHVQDPAVMVNARTLERLALLLGPTAAMGKFFWATARPGGTAGATGPAVVVRLLPLQAAHPCIAPTNRSNGDGGGSPSESCWLSSAAASSFGLSFAFDRGGAHTDWDIVLNPGGAARAELHTADSVHVTVNIVPGDDALRAKALSVGTAGGKDGAEAESISAAELGLVSARLVPIIRSHLAAQVWSEGMSTRARMGATPLLLTVSTLKHRSGSVAAPPGFAKAMLIDQDTSVSVCVSSQPAVMLHPEPSFSHTQQDQQEVISKWVAAAGSKMGGVTTELTRTAVAIYSSLSSASEQHLPHSTVSSSSCSGNTSSIHGGEKRRQELQGMIVWGPPGTGKSKLVTTLLETSPFAWLSCNATELFKADKGATDAEIQGLFLRAQERAPSILFIDEIDAICSNSAGAQAT